MGGQIFAYWPKLRTHPVLFCWTNAVILYHVNKNTLTWPKHFTTKNVLFHSLQALYILPDTYLSKLLCTLQILLFFVLQMYIISDINVWNSVWSSE